MAEFAAVIEVWFEADDDGDAQAVVTRLSTIVRGQPRVKQVESERPEEQ